jgi:serine protease
MRPITAETVRVIAVLTNRRRPLSLLAAVAAPALAALALAASANATAVAGPAGVAPAAAAAAAATYVPGAVVIGYSAPSSTVLADVAQRMGVRAAGPAAARAAMRSHQQLLRLPRGTMVHAAIARLRHRRGVAYAVPDYIAHQAGTWIPNDPGRGTTPEGWQAVQWNFMPGEGINAPEAWSNLIADHRPGASGEVVAILDTGVAYRNWHQFRKSPDFTSTRFVDPYDFVAGNAYPLDREGHGTFVTGSVAEATNNGIGVTGLAYGAAIMPVRVLNAQGNGDAVTIADGIRYAVDHGANVINLSLEFGLQVNVHEIPEVISALQFAHDRGVVVVAAAGNDSGNAISYPARDPLVISVGATTKDRCLADYSDTGKDLDIVAPGGGDDAALGSDPDCHPSASLPDVYQTTFYSPSDPGHFGLPGGWYGTSMSSPDVAAAAAMVIASNVIGRNPSPTQVLTRLEQTAQPLGATVPNPDYGFGLLDAGAATTPPPPATTPPATPTTTTTTPTSTTPTDG